MNERVKQLVRFVIPHLYGEPGETRTGRNFRRMRIGNRPAIAARSERDAVT